MSYKLNNAIIKKDKEGNLTLVDPENYFKDKEAIIAIDSDDYITLQLLINSIVNNDFKRWKDISSFKGDNQVKDLFIKLGYTKEDIGNLLKEL